MSGKPEWIQETTLEEPGEEPVVVSSGTPGSSSAGESNSRDRLTPRRSPRRPATTKRGVGEKAVTSSASESELVRPSACSRWMFHRKGVFCKGCGKTP